MTLHPIFSRTFSNCLHLIFSTFILYLEISAKRMQSAEGIKGVGALLNGCEKNISRALEGLLFFLNE